jgi:hypothetical protein
MADISRIHRELVESGFLVDIKNKPGWIRELTIVKEAHPFLKVVVSIETIDRPNFDNTDKIINDIKKAFKESER